MSPFPGAAVVVAASGSLVLEAVLVSRNLGAIPRAALRLEAELSAIHRGDGSAAHRGDGGAPYTMDAAAALPSPPLFKLLVTS